jgi:KipI family sensor histidine kinase inhibitor
MRLRPYGTSAVLVETDSPPALVRDLVAGRAGIGEVVPGARTLLVEYDPSVWTLEQLGAALAAPVGSATAPGGHVEIPVRYDGADLAAVAELTRLTVDDVVRRHTDATYTVAFCGFSPGFAYLTGLDPVLHVPRLDQPRTSVPAGAVAIAGEYSAVYPAASPGGWRLLGTTQIVLWDLDRQPPALLAPGTTVRFVTA